VAGPFPDPTRPPGRNNSAGTPRPQARLLDRVAEAVADSPELIGPLDVTRRPDLTGMIRNGFAGIELAARLRYGGLDLTAPLALGLASADTAAWASSNDYDLMTISPPRSGPQA
jgi:hypothetical protein